MSTNAYFGELRVYYLAIDPNRVMILLPAVSFDTQLDVALAALNLGLRSTRNYLADIICGFLRDISLKFVLFEYSFTRTI